MLGRLNGTRIIDREKTIDLFGYDPDLLSHGSAKKVVSNCSQCGEIFHLAKRRTNHIHNCKVIRNETMICSKCKEWKSLHDFFSTKTGKNNLRSECKSCYANHESNRQHHLNKKNRRKFAYANDMRFYIKNILSSIKDRCNKNNIPFDLSVDFLLKLWDEQTGKCYYTSISMKKEEFEDRKSEWSSPSVDRIIPSVGYIEGNVNWVCSGVNWFKGRLDNYNFLNIINNINWNSFGVNTKLEEDFSI